MGAGLAANVLVDEAFEFRQFDSVGREKEDAFHSGHRDGDQPVIDLLLLTFALVAPYGGDIHQRGSFAVAPLIAMSMAACAGSMLRRIAFATGIGTPPNV